MHFFKDNENCLNLKNYIVSQICWIFFIFYRLKMSSKYFVFIESCGIIAFAVETIIIRDGIFRALYGVLEILYR